MECFFRGFWYPWLNFFIWKLWVHKVFEFITWQNQEFSKLPFWSLKFYCHFNIVLTTNYKVYYKQDNVDYFQVWVVMCFVNVSFSWFAHSLFWLWKSALIAIFIYLCKLISFWTQTCKLVLISFWNWHTFILWKLDNAPCVWISLQYKKSTCFLPLIPFDKSSDTLMNFKNQTSLINFKHWHVWYNKVVHKIILPLGLCFILKGCVSAKSTNFIETKF